MADVLESVFRRHGGLNSRTQTGQDGVFCHHSAECSSVVVLAVDRDVSFALLFLAAVTAAAELDLKVLFYTHTVIQKFPVPINDLTTDLKPDHLKKIKFVYRRSLEELLLDVASQHELGSGVAASAPSLVLVDGLDSYLHSMGATGETGGARPGVSPASRQSNELSTAAHLAALLTDTSSFLTRIQEEMTGSRGMDRGTVVPCRVIVSYHSAHAKPMAADCVSGVLARYFSTQCTLVKDVEDSAAEDEFTRHKWRVNLSRTAVQDGAASELEWRLVVHTNGAMEFSPIDKPTEYMKSDLTMEGASNS